LAFGVWRLALAAAVVTAESLLTIVLDAALKERQTPNPKRQTDWVFMKTKTTNIL